MEDSGAILCQISSFKDMLDQVNEEIEANIQVTREIESKIVKCTEIETALAARESELTRTAYALQFEIAGLMKVHADSEASLKHLDEKICYLRRKRDEIHERINNRRDEFVASCLAFQNEVYVEDNDEIHTLLAEKERLQNEIHSLDKKNRALESSTAAFVEEVLEELQQTVSALEVEIRCGNIENEKLLKNIDELKKTLSSIMLTGLQKMHFKNDLKFNVIFENDVEADVTDVEADVIVDVGRCKLQRLENSQLINDKRLISHSTVGLNPITILKWYCSLNSSFSFNFYGHESIRSPLLHVVDFVYVFVFFCFLVPLLILTGSEVEETLTKENHGVVCNTEELRS
ncbi:putative autophagy-related protein 3-like [Capsicum annuum]|nr:putative autophagy-related protein 3-like [Capsicum annuum]KAF3680838.1 putative autophagy-related protein 3-like [Capsicum annuum]